ncbi:hypothetical protein GW17_00020389 [Ensete ventricosum]|nr:hypothetical protein GW17_00020389 [Ensete ventricosum]
MEALWYQYGITVHNFPEGMAVFIGTTKGLRIGITFALAIALHNIPEGVAVALPVYYATESKWQAFKLAALSGFAEPLGVIIIEIDRQRSIEEEKGKKKKRKRRRRRRRRRREVPRVALAATPPGGRSLAVAARRFFSPRAGENSRRPVRPRTARYIPVRQLIGMQTDRYRVVPLKSTVDDRFRLSAIDFDRRRSIEGEIDRRRLIEEEKGKRRKKKYLAAVLACSLLVRPRVTREMSLPSQPAGDYRPFISFI